MTVHHGVTVTIRMILGSNKINSKMNQVQTEVKLWNNSVKQAKEDVPPQLIGNASGLKCSCN